MGLVVCAGPIVRQVEVLCGDTLLENLMKISVGLTATSRSVLNAPNRAGNSPRLTE